MDYHREFLEKEGSQDCFGRCLWALCYTFSNSATPQNVKKAVWKLIEKALPNCLKLVPPRSIAYAMIGLGYLDSEKPKEYISNMAILLAERYNHHNDGDWHWFEDSMTYCNATLPWAMLIAYRVTKENRYQDIGFQSLNFLESKTFQKKLFQTNRLQWMA
jgi:hypothetical protein